MLKSMRKSKNRYFYHIFVSPGDTAGAITLNIVWMEKECDAYKLPRSIYPSIFNSFPVIRTASAKNRHFHVPRPTFLFPLETPLRLSRNMLHGWKHNSMLAKPLAARTYLSSIDVIHERDRQTDRQTDGHWMTAKTALASHRAVKTVFEVLYY